MGAEEKKGKIIASDKEAKQTIEQRNPDFRVKATEEKMERVQLILQ